MTTLLDNLTSIRDELVKQRQRFLVCQPDSSGSGQVAPSGGAAGATVATAPPAGSEAGATGGGAPSLWSMQVCEWIWKLVLVTVTCINRN